MDDFIGSHGFVTDPDTVINDPDALVDVSLQGNNLKTYRFIFFSRTYGC